ncbi:hypothetical protein SKAU_G00026640 [Synaphobranchus kaupii]|uniref:Uncharacterized protein n=1 Tax=Synaphobranchus kaupii TaxID=118154 RepID=A0A9Q1GCU5_SYNKA|nr:hypothetical protein SKAU_G00026640 [Synaphobranchus kaupii]
MVVQGTVTPGRTRRLLLKLPVGTLRHSSAERLKYRAKLSACGPLLQAEEVPGTLFCRPTKRNLLWNLTSTALRRWHIRNPRAFNLLTKPRCIPWTMYQRGRGGRQGKAGLEQLDSSGAISSSPPAQVSKRQDFLWRDGGDMDSGGQHFYSPRLQSHVDHPSSTEPPQL